MIETRAICSTPACRETGNGPGKDRRLTCQILRQLFRQGFLVWGQVRTKALHESASVRQKNRVFDRERDGSSRVFDCLICLVLSVSFDQPRDYSGTWPHS